MMDRMESPQCGGKIGISRKDITPPVGMYHRMWGAAKHDRSTSVHKPLLLTAMWIEADKSTHSANLVLAMDHCILDGEEIKNIRAKVSTATQVAPQDIEICLSHTHGSGWMSRSRSELPGGEMIGPYLDDLARICAEASVEARGNCKPAWITFGTGTCHLARHRDYFDPRNNSFVCGFNPKGFADSTLLVGRIDGEDGKCIGTVVNYACHPTTLAWENTSISPDYIGSFRELVEEQTGAPCIFLQGASGDLGPREGFVGDHATADRNGRKLGFATLATIEDIPPAKTRFVYKGPVISGAILGTWHDEPISKHEIAARRQMISEELKLDLPYRPDLPSLSDTKAQKDHWEAEEAKAISIGDHLQARDARALVEQMTRQITRLSVLPQGKTFPHKTKVFIWGETIWIFAQGELYQSIQMTLRQRFPEYAVVVVTVANDWQPGYLPEASTYGYGIYQEKIATLAAGSLEILTESLSRKISGILGKKVTKA